MHNGVDHAITFPYDFPIGEPQHAIAPKTEIVRAFGVISSRRIGAVLIAVQFDNEFCTVATEIGDVFGEGDLAAEMETNSLEIAKARPQDAFSVGRVLPKHPGKCVGHYPHPEPFTSAAPHPKNVSRFSTSPQGGGEGFRQHPSGDLRRDDSAQRRRCKLVSASATYSERRAGTGPSGYRRDGPDSDLNLPLAGRAIAYGG